MYIFSFSQLWADHDCEVVKASLLLETSNYATQMVKVFYTISNNVSETKWLTMLGLLPSAMKQKALSYRKRHDQLNSVIGKLLLVQGLREMNLSYSLECLNYTSSQRPYINSRLDFNISHSLHCVICAISCDCKVGVDVERIGSVRIEDFENQWTKKEWDYLIHSKDQLKEFYDYWTRKEAIVKADGNGLSIALNTFDVTSNNVTVSGAEWFLDEIKIGYGYVAYLASNKLVSGNIDVRQIEF